MAADAAASSAKSLSRSSVQILDRIHVLRDHTTSTSTAKESYRDTNTRSNRHHHAKSAKMHLMYTLDPNGKRRYTLKKIVDGEVTKSAHPARFSPDDKYSRYDMPVHERGQAVH